MKAIILAGGVGSRLSEETVLRPKPMIEIGGKPIIWHLMKYYSAFGVLDFIICCGYKGYVIKEYFANYFLHTSDVTFNLVTNTVDIHHKHAEPWKVTLVDTGEETLTGGRLKRVRQYVGQETFFFTYGDGLSNVALNDSMALHKKMKMWATLTAVKPPGRYGAIVEKGGSVIGFQEKPGGDGAWINGGFFILEPAVFDLIGGDGDSFESDTLPKLVEAKQLAAYTHSGFWHAMDTLRDKNFLEQIWTTGSPPWKLW